MYMYMYIMMLTNFSCRKPQGHFCGASHDHHDDIEIVVPFNKFNSHTHNDINYKSDSSGRLKRRQAIIEAFTVCPVKLVATTSFFEHFGASNGDHTINFLVSNQDYNGTLLYIGHTSLQGTFLVPF